MTVCVTGLTGFLGAHIGMALLDQGLAVRGVVRTPSKGAWLAERGVTFAAAELSDVDALTAGFQGADVVVANAALSVRDRKPPLQEYLDANLTGTETVLRAAARAGVRRVVYISSTAVYRVRLGQVMGEDAEQVTQRTATRSLSRVTTNWRYALSKQLGEARAWALARELDLELTTLRPGPIYGSRDHKVTAGYRAKLQKRVLLVPTVRLPHVHAGDVAQAVCGAIDNRGSIGRAYNTAGNSVSLLRILRAARSALGSNTALVPLWVPLGAEFSDARAEAELGYRSRPVEEGMVEAFGG